MPADKHAADKHSEKPDTGMRLDKWLWAARFYKTRRLAVDAVGGGKVQCNGERAKPGKSVRCGDRLTVRKGVYEFIFEITGLSPLRLSADLAQTLYRETEDSVTRRELRRNSLAADKAAQPHSGDGRPNKRQRRQLLSAKNRYFPR